MKWLRNLIAENRDRTRERKERERILAEAEAIMEARRRRVRAMKTPCGRAKIANGWDPRSHCPYPMGYDREGPCRFGDICGFTEERWASDYEEAERFL